MIRIISKNIEAEQQKIRKYLSSFDDKQKLSIVARIISEVRKKKDNALIKYTRQLDHFKLTPKNICVSRKEINSAYQKAEEPFILAIRQAIKNITEYHLRQWPHSWTEKDYQGNILGLKFSPIEKVGVYIPGGSAAYPSSVLMSVIPAKIAEVKEIVMVTPPPINSHVLAAAKEVGIERIFRIGGAQAIAALAYGTKLVPKVDKIVGPGNIFVTLAKKLVYGVCDIDKLAGPSDILIIADEKANPRWIAADLLAQAEHDELSSSILITDSKKLVPAVVVEIKKILPCLTRKEIIKKSLQNYGRIFLVKNIEQAIELANQIAPEHLELCIENPETVQEKLKHFGALFIGPFSPVVIGDYSAGPNHILPSGGTARFSSMLGVTDFIKRSSITHFNEEGLRGLYQDTIKIAEIEGLDAHQQSIKVRFE